MAFNVQDATGEIADANAYIALTFLNSWLDDAGAVNTYLDPAKQQAIVQATRYIDSKYCFSGRKLNYDPEDAQTTEFPRDETDPAIYLWLERATAEYAKFILEGGSLWSSQETSELGITRAKEKVDVLETDYSYSGSTSSRNFASVPIADKLISNSGWLSGKGIITRT